MSTEISRPRRILRRLLRFSLATFLAAFTVVSLWLGWETYLARRQKSTVALIKEVGGTVGYEQELAKARERAALKRSLKGAPMPEEVPTTRDKIEAVVGRDYFDTPTQLRFVDRDNLTRPDPPKVTLELVERIGKLPRLEVLDLSFNEGVTDDLLAPLAGMTSLKRLQFYCSAIRGPGLAHIARLTNLEYIDLSHTQVDDEGLKWISGLKNLTGLSIGYTRITDAGLAHLDGLESLETITLRSTAVGDEALKLLAKFPNLRGANMQHTRVTPEGLAQFQKEFPKKRVLTEFGFGKTPVDVDWQLGEGEPSPAHLNARFKALGIRGLARTDPATPDGPIMSIRIGLSAVSDAAILRLVEKLPSLVELTMGGVVGDELLAGLAGNQSIGMLCLPDTRVTDEGLQHLSKLPKLQYLVFNECAVTDEGMIKYVTPLTGLRGITMQDSDVSLIGIRALQKALPKLEIRY